MGLSNREALINLEVFILHSNDGNMNTAAQRTAQFDLTPSSLGLRAFASPMIRDQTLPDNGHHSLPIAFRKLYPAGPYSLIRKFYVV